MSEGPLLEVGSWKGPVEALIRAARCQSVNLRTIPLTTLIEQLLFYVEEGLKERPLEQTADCLVQAATLIQIRSALLLQHDTIVHAGAVSDAEQIRQRLTRKEALERASQFFEARPILGETVFARGNTDISPFSADKASSIQIWDLLEALLSLSRRRARIQPGQDIFRLSRITYLSVGVALEWWHQRLRKEPHGRWGLSDGVGNLPGPKSQSQIQHNATCAAHFLAVLELGKQGELHLHQSAALERIEIIQSQHEHY